MTTVRTRLLAAGAVSALLLTPLAACGGDDDATPSQSQTGPTATATGTVGVVDEDAFVTKVLAAIDAKSSVHMEIAGGSFLNATADLAYGEEKASKITASIYGGTQVIVATGGVVYLQASPGAPFTVVEKSTPVLGPLVDTFSSLGPRESVQGIRGGISEVVQDGPTEYTVTVDTAKLTGALKLLAGTSSASEDLGMRFTLDASDLVQKIDFEISGEPVTITFTDWDVPVTVEKPKVG